MKKYLEYDTDKYIDMLRNRCKEYEDELVKLKKDIISYFRYVTDKKWFKKYTKIIKDDEAWEKAISYYQNHYLLGDKSKAFDLLEEYHNTIYFKNKYEKEISNLETTKPNKVYIEKA